MRHPMQSGISTALNACGRLIAVAREGEGTQVDRDVSVAPGS
jgi:hypothetical protein